MKLYRASRWDQKSSAKLPTTDAGLPPVGLSSKWSPNSKPASIGQASLSSASRRGYSILLVAGKKTGMLRHGYNVKYLLSPAYQTARWVICCSTNSSLRRKTQVFLTDHQKNIAYVDCRRGIKHATTAQVAILLDGTPYSSIALWFRILNWTVYRRTEFWHSTPHRCVLKSFHVVGYWWAWYVPSSRWTIGILNQLQVELKVQSESPFDGMSYALWTIWWADSSSYWARIVSMKMMDGNHWNIRSNQVPALDERSGGD